MTDYKLKKFHEIVDYGKEYLATAQAAIADNAAVATISTFGKYPHDIDIEIQRDGENLWIIIDDNRNPNNLMRGNVEVSVRSFLIMTRPGFDFLINNTLAYGMFPDPE